MVTPLPFHSARMPSVLHRRAEEHHSVCMLGPGPGSSTLAGVQQELPSSAALRQPAPACQPACRQEARCVHRKHLPHWQPALAAHAPHYLLQRRQRAEAGGDGLPARRRRLQPLHLRTAPRRPRGQHRVCALRVALER